METLDQMAQYVDAYARLTPLQKAIVKVIRDKRVSLFYRARASVILCEITKGKLFLNPKTGEPMFNK